MYELVKTVAFEETIKGSRFLSELIICKSQNQAREILKEQKNKYSDATHVVHAFITGPNAEIMGMSDDGEPPGTAGRPVLDVLKGRSCTNLMLTVTRWFGGTLLGTGGLVKAYSGGAKGVLDKAIAENALELIIPKKDFSFTIPYSILKPVKLTMQNYQIWDLQEQFATDVTLTGRIKEDEFENLKAYLTTVTNGKVILG